MSTIVLAACGGSDDAADTSSETTAATAEEVELSATEGGILAAVQERGVLRCGVSGAAVAFSYTQADGSMQGIDADYCRAVAAAVLGD
ncbi:MAG: amino acid ABC transporter substrate-binding protein, partial [Ilumatobacteraceae bacterium]